MHPKDRKPKAWVDGEERDIELMSLPKSAAARAKFRRWLWGKYRAGLVLGGLVSVVAGTITLFLAVRKIRLRRMGEQGMGMPRPRRKAPKTKSGKRGAGRLQVSK